MPNFTGVIASARLVCSCAALNAAISASRRSTSPVVERPGPRPLPAARGGGPAGRTAWSGPRRRSCAGAARRASIPSSGRAAAEDVLDHEHALRAAEAAERGLRGLVGLRDPAVHRGCSGSSRRCRCGTAPGPAPARTGRGSSRRRRSASPSSAWSRPSSSKPTCHVGVEAVPLAGHRHVLGAG